MGHHQVGLHHALGSLESVATVVVAVELEHTDLTGLAQSGLSVTTDDSCSTAGFLSASVGPVTPELLGSARPGASASP